VRLAATRCYGLCIWVRSGVNSGANSGAWPKARTVCPNHSQSGAVDCTETQTEDHDMTMLSGVETTAGRETELQYARRSWHTCATETDGLNLDCSALTTACGIRFG